MDELSMKVNWDKVVGLIPAIIQSVKDREVLMLGYMDREALEKTLKEKRVCFYSRTKQRLWTKGETSGNYLKVCNIRLDCDHDAVLVEVEPMGSVCHKGTHTCFSKPFWLEEIIDTRRKENDPNSYVCYLNQKGPSYISQKVGEEAIEVALASVQENKEKILEESADLLFHLLVNLNHHGLSLEKVDQVLRRRHENGIHQKKS